MNFTRSSSGSAVVLGQVEEPGAEVEAGQLPVGEALRSRRRRSASGSLRRSGRGAAASAAVRAVAGAAGTARSRPARVEGVSPEPWGLPPDVLPATTLDPVAGTRRRAAPHPGLARGGPSPGAGPSSACSLFGDVIIGALLRPGLAGPDVPHPAPPRAVPRRRPRPRPGRPPGQPLAGPRRQPGGAAARRPAQRHRLRGHRPLEPAPGQAQAAWAASAIVAYVLTLLVVRRSRDLDRYRYLLLLAAALLDAGPAHPRHRADGSTGARLWVHLGPTSSSSRSRSPRSCSASSSPRTSPRTRSCSPSRRPGSATAWSSTPGP